MFKKLGIVTLVGLGFIDSASAQTAANTQSVINAMPRNFVLARSKNGLALQTPYEF